MLRFKAVPPKVCSQVEIRQFIGLVEQGGEVADGLETRVIQAKTLILAADADVVQAVAALKVPSLGYRNSVFRKAGEIDLADNFPFEVGWIYVSRKYRGAGISHKLLHAAVTSADGQKVFATTRANNIPMRKTLQKAEFSPFGARFPSVRNPDIDLQLFVKFGDK